MRPVTIVGGGIAGLSLALGLRKYGVPVHVFEAGHYPRHRVCGEFISGRGQEILRELNLEHSLLAAGAGFAREAGFWIKKRQMRPRALPSPALAVSRFTLDACLRDAVVAAGGSVQDGTRWRGDHSQPGLVLASGRNVQAIERGWRWVGLKVHARAVDLEHDLEMHLLHNAYVGLCRVDEGKVNICGLFRLAPERDKNAPITADLLRGEPGTPLNARLATAVFEPESFCAVAGLSLQPRHHEDWQTFRIGDALTMTPPVTGNGMSMALESAHIAAGPLVEFSIGRIAWQQAIQDSRAALDRAFSRRLRVAGLLQRFIFSAWFQQAATATLGRCFPVWRAAFALTR